MHEPPPPLPPTSVSQYLAQPVVFDNQVVPGTQGMSLGDMEEDVLKGGRFMVFHYAVSLLIMTFRRNTNIRYVRSDDSDALYAWPCTLVSLFFGWWGFPWGLIYTPLCIYRNAWQKGDVTPEVLQMLLGPERANSIAAKRAPKSAGLSAYLMRALLIAIPIAFILFVRMVLSTPRR